MACKRFGATQYGRYSCGVSTIGSTSFYPAKPLGCYGDGGALFTNDDALASQMRAIRVHGGEQRHHHTCLGFNGRFDTLQAAIMLVKMKYFPAEVHARADIGARYTQLLQDCCVTPEIAKGNTHVYAQYTIRVSDRDALAKRLQANGIPTAIHYPKCLHEQPVFADLGYHWGSFPHAEKASREVISLPMHPYLTALEQEEIAAQVRDAVLVMR